MPRLTVPMGISYVAYLTLNPLKGIFRVASWQKRILYTLLIGVILALLVTPIVSIIDTITTEASNLSSFWLKLDTLLKEKFLKLQSFALDQFDIQLDFNPTKTLISKMQQQGQQVLVWLPKMLSTTIEWVILVPLFLVFFFKDSQTLKRSFFKIVPNAYFERVYVLFHQFNTKFGDYITAKLIEASILGVLLTFGLYLIGYPYYVIIGLIGGVTSILPYFGPVIGYIPIVLVGLIEVSGQQTLLAGSLVFLIANLIDIVLVFPFLVSKIVNLNPLVVIASVIVGSQFGGVIGMVVSIPITAFFKLLLFEVYKELYVD